MCAGIQDSACEEFSDNRVRPRDAAPVPILEVLHRRRAKGKMVKREPPVTVSDRSLSREPSHGHYIAGHEPPKTPVVDGLGLWSWMLPPPPLPGEQGAYEPK